MTPKDPFLEGTFLDKFWRPIRSRALLFTPDLFCGSEKSRKIPAKIPTKFRSQKSKKKFTDELLQERREKNLPNWPFLDI